MSETATLTVPALPTFLPRPAGIPVAPFSMQKILSKVIRTHADNQNLANTKVRGPDKMGSSRRSGARGGGKRSAARATAGNAKK